MPDETPHSTDPGVPRSPGRALDALAIALFLGAIFAPLVDLAVRPAEVRSPEVELRQPAPFPSLAGQAAWVRFPEAFEDWWNDSFGLRDRLLRWHSLLKIGAFRVSPSERMVLGRDDWIFSTVERSMDVFRGLAPLTEKELEWWRIALESRRDWCAERGIAFVYALAPSKQAVYPERMPSSLTVTGPTRVDQLVDYLAARSDLRVLDLRESQERAKAADDPAAGDFAYYPLGTHWSVRGAYAATRALRDRIAGSLPAVGAVELPESVRWVRDETSQGDSWAARLYVEDVLRQTVWRADPDSLPGVELSSEEQPARRALVFEQAGVDLPSALVFHDSFGQGLFEFLPRLFRRTHFVWKSDFDLDLIERERPDVVLQLLVDRTLVSLSPRPVGDAGRDFARRQFEASSDVLLAGDAAAALEPYRDAELAPSDGGLAIETLTPGGLVLLPEIRFPRGANPVLFIELDSPHATTLDVLYQTAADPEYKRTRVYDLAVAPGPNELYVELLVPDLAGRLAVRPGRAPGRYVLRALEVRAVPR